MIGARSASGIALGLLLTAWLCWPSPATHAMRRQADGAKGPPAQFRGTAPQDLEGEFAYAVALYRQGHLSSSFGKFLELANRGDADAAHIALFMSRYGVALYGTHWETYPADLQDWARLIVDRDGRHLPVFIPDPYEPTPTAKPSRHRAAAERKFREGRFAAAFAAFAQLGNRGDADAAHAALFMDKYGPLLFGSSWRAEAHDRAGWRRLVADPTPARPGAAMPL